MKSLVTFFAAAALGGLAPAYAQGSFVNYETPHVSPLALSPGASTLVACNTMDNRVEVFDIVAGAPVHRESIVVGLDPVSVRFRTETELWVVNSISDSVSIVDLQSGQIKATLRTLDEPADVVFAGSPKRAFVSCAQVDVILVFDPANLDAAPIEIPLEEDSPRTLAITPDGSAVYVAFFESGNGTPIDGGAADLDLFPFATNGVNDPAGPYGGANPPPQVATPVNPITPVNPDLPPAPASTLGMTIGDGHNWQDGAAIPFADMISGNRAGVTGRPVGWDRTDYGIAIIDAATLAVDYVKNLATQNTAVAVNPINGHVAVVGLRAHNYIRFETDVAGGFTTVNIFFYFPETGALDLPPGPALHTVNPHIPRAFPNRNPQSERDKSVGDPRGMVWREDGQVVYVSGMGSNNIGILDGAAHRAGSAANGIIEVGEGPTGIVLDEGRDRLYVLNRFEGSISTVSTATELEIDRVPFFDPTPGIINRGRRHFYNTRATSGTGEVACATCHIDGKTDKMSWNLGVPDGHVKPLPPDTNRGGGIPGLADDLEDWHPVKGDMVTQTLQDIIGKEPLHWRGDRANLEEFNPAFMGLLGGDRMLSDQEMADFKGFIATIAFPPNPDRNLDNSLPTDLPLPAELKTSGIFGPAGQPLPNGDAVRGLDLFRNALPAEGLQLTCITCHTLPTGMGTGSVWNGETWEELPPGPTGEKHHALVSITGSTQKSFKVPQLRSVREKLGFDLTAPVSRQGFGFFHDGAVDTLSRLLSKGHFAVTQSDQDVADLAAFLLAFTGSDFPTDPNDPPGPSSNDSHAAIGVQVTLDGTDSGAAMARLLDLVDLANDGRIALTLRRQVDGIVRGAVYLGDGDFQSDQAMDTWILADLLAAASADSPQTYTAVPLGTEERIGLDRDEDGIRDHDEVRSFEGTLTTNPFDPANPDATGDGGVVEADGVLDGENDFDGDSLGNAAELEGGTNPLADDSDGDGLSDGVEVNTHHTDPNDADSDGDTLNDGAEIETHLTNPLSSDSDSDTLGDADEINIHGTNPNESDSDTDGLDDAVELNEHGTNPNVADTDGDNLDDSAEVNTHGTNPVDDDTDGDTLDDGAEINDHGTDPSSADSDGDSLSDGAEVNTHATDPNDTDSDGDGLDDADEINLHSTDPNDTDSDGDGLGDGAEIDTHDTDPNESDTDGDTLTDGTEVNTHHTNPLSVDSDGDTLTDSAEINTHASNPNAADSDGDGLDDAVEVNTHGTNPNDDDSDGDALPDEWEVTNELDPNSADGDDGGAGDPDGDDLTNSQELADGTNPQEANGQPQGCSSGASPGVTLGGRFGDALAAALTVMALKVFKRSDRVSKALGSRSSGIGRSECSREVNARVDPSG